MKIQEQINVVVEAREKASETNRNRTLAYQKWMEFAQPLFDAEKTAKETCQEAEGKLREMAIETYLKTLDKAVAPGVSIRMMTKLSYDAKVALNWAMHHELALKLDATAFEKIAKTSNMSFVTISEEPTATIATELSKMV